MSRIHQVNLAGCAPDPLAFYLKALAVMRLVTEGEDADARGYWRNEVFVLVSKLDGDFLINFFLSKYKPTPIVAPWNGSSGFFPPDNSNALNSIESSSNPRLSSYREVIETAKRLCKRIGLEEKPSKEQKEHLQNLCRNEFSEKAIQWLDAAFVLTDYGAKYPPLFGLGGIDGHLEFTNNFMQRICDVIPMTEEQGPTVNSSLWLRSALYGDPIPNLAKNSVGQFFPSAAGGSNATSGFKADSLINPWDFILMIEGALLFASASVRRLGHLGPGVLAYPFTVKHLAVGHGSSTLQDEKTARPEMWMPLWESPCSLSELRAVFSEGRARVGTRQATNGLDFARAVASLGVDRGITSFQRYGFQQRHGKDNYFAVPLSRAQVRYHPEVDILASIDRWIQEFRRKASDKETPAAILRALHRLDMCVWSLCQKGGQARLLDVLVCLGLCEKTLASRISWLNKSGIRPIPLLPPKWIEESYDGSAEFRLAASLASITAKYKDKEGKPYWLSVRSHLEPVKISNRRVSWCKGSDGNSIKQTNDVVWQEGNPVLALNKIFKRRLILAEQSGHETWSDFARVNSLVEDVGVFLEGGLNLERFSDLLWGLVLVDWPKIEKTLPWSTSKELETWVGAAFALLKLCFSGKLLKDSVKIPLVPAIHYRAVSGDGGRAINLAIRRLRGSDLAPAVKSVAVKGELSKKLAAAMLFPLSTYAIAQLEKRIITRI